MYILPLESIVRLNLKKNIMDGESSSAIVGDAVVDVGAASLAIAGVASAEIVGTFGSPLIAGAVIGLGVSALFTSMKLGGKSIFSY